MKVTKFDYSLPRGRIAQYPPRVRGEARLLVVDRKTGELTDTRYQEVSEYLAPGDLLVVNVTKVLPARLYAKTKTGGRRELMLLEKHERWERRVRPALVGGKVRVGDSLWVGKEKLAVEKNLGDGAYLIKCACGWNKLINQAGHVPLPPYIKRADEAIDKQRYQTELARVAGSVAAPTASLNLTLELLQRIRAKGVKVAEVTLHVGRGTFLPVRTTEVARHRMHREYYQVPAATVRLIEAARRRGGAVVAVGTTVARALEQAADEILQGEARDLAGEAEIFIYPGYRFRVVDRLLTNFHAPRSTVVLLAAAVAGADNLTRAYDHALANGYMFLSYGDSMYIK